MNVGIILALLVLVACFIAFVFGAAAPDWLPYLLIGMLALAVLLSGLSVPWRIKS